MAQPRQDSSDRSPNVVSLRHATSAKKAKARLTDPAAAPVGTDAEAAGASSMAEQAAAAAHAEMTRQVYSRDPTARDQSPAATTAVILVAIAVAAVVTVAAVLWTRV